MSAFHRFESRLQGECAYKIREHAHCLQNKCRDHVGMEEMKLRIELQHTLQHDTHESDVVHTTMELPAINLRKHFLAVG